MADRVRLSLFCPTCLPGYHLPFFTGVAQGVFADHGLVVDIIDPPPPPGSTNSHRVASGGAEFGLTGVTYHLFALAEAGGSLAARFVAMVHQRSALGAIVRADSDITAAGELAGRRIGRGELTGWLADECGQVLDDRGMGQPEYVPLDHGEAPFALGRGDVDIVATMVDAMVGVGEKGGRPVRAIHLGHEIYSSGLVAADSVPTEVVERMRLAVAASFEVQRADPGAAIAEYCGRFPDVSPETARASWDLLVPFAFAGAGVGTMDRGRWAATLDWLTLVHDLPTFPPGGVYREELALRQPSDATARGTAA